MRRIQKRMQMLPIVGYNNYGYVFHKHLKPKILFRQHNLIKDAPMSKIDLLMCRNVLIYLNIEAQIRVLARFYFSVVNSGFLCLGKAELLPINGSMPIFNLINHQNHIFNKVPKQNLDQYLLPKALGQSPQN